MKHELKNVNKKSDNARFISYLQGSNEGQLLRIPVMNIRFPHDLIERRCVH